MKDDAKLRTINLIPGRIHAFSVVLRGERPMALTIQPVLVATDEEGEGCLVFADGWLVAVLVRLSDVHEAAAGCWFLEKGFGEIDGTESPVFSNLDLAQEWISASLVNRARPVLPPPVGRQT